jgi:hypothetical protein
MAWPNQNTTNESAAGALLLSNAIAAGITSAGSLSQTALIQEAISNLLIEPPPGWTLTALTAAIATTSSIKSSSATGGIGYATGAGGLVTQASNKSTAVTLNKICGQIVTNNAALIAGVEVTFTVTNTSIAATDTVLANYASGGTTGVYAIVAGNIQAGASYDITISALGAGSYTEAITINVSLWKGVAA